MSEHRKYNIRKDKPKSKRNRIPLSCEPCRRKKIKCDRSKPYCTSCVKSNVTDRCIYRQLDVMKSPNSNMSNGSYNDLRNTDINFNKSSSFHNLLEHPSESNLTILPPIQSLNVNMSDSLTSTKYQKPNLQNLMTKLKSISDVSNVNDISNGVQTVNASLNKLKNGDMFPLTNNHRLISDVRSTSPGNISYTNNSNSSPGSTNKGIFQELEINDDDIINFHEGFIPMLYKFSRISNFGPLTWISIILKDPFIRPLRDKVVQKMQKVLFQVSNENENHYQNIFLKHAGLDDIKPLNLKFNRNTLIDQEKKSELNKDSMPKRKCSSYLRYKINLTAEEFVLHEILKVLPNKKIIWASIKRYFMYVYPFLPYLDQTGFTEDISILLNTNIYTDKDSEENIENIFIRKRLDFAVLGTLLLVLKFAENSLIINEDPNDGSIKRTNEEQYLIDHSLPKNVLNIAKLCLNQFKLLSRCALPIFQFALLMKEYEKHHGIDDGFSTDCQIFNAMLIEMGIAIGMNRDPSKYDLLVGRGKLGNLWRKIWYGLLSLDNRQYTLFGSGKITREGFYDTQLPAFDEESSNIDNYDLEKVVIDKIRLNYQFEQDMLEIADYICNFKTEPNIKVLMKKLIKLEHKVLTNLGTIKEILNKKKDLFTDKVKKVWDYTICVDCLGFILCIYHHLCIHYQHLGNLKVTKFMKAKLNFYWLNVFANFPIISKRCYKYFGTGFDMICNQCTLPIIHKGMVGYMSLYVETTIALAKSNNNPERIKQDAMLRRLDDMVTDCKVWYLPNLKVLSKRYFYAWKLMKAHTLIIGLIRDKSFAFLQMFNLYNSLEHMNETELRNLVELLTPSNYSVESTESKNFTVLKNNIINNKPFTNINYADFDIYDYNNNNNSNNNNNNNNNNNTVINSTNHTNKSSINDIMNPDLVPEVENLTQELSDDKLVEEDEFWKDVFENKWTYINNPSTTDGVFTNPNYDALLSNIENDGVQPNVLGYDDIMLEMNRTNTSPDTPLTSTSNPMITSINNPSNLPGNGNDESVNDTNLFVDRTIYEMFN